ncbi:MAG: calcium/sodium antiporter [Gammaproteobacteria bacterium]
MLLAITAVILGFVLLIWGADRFVHGAAGIAATLGVSPIIIGLTIVGFGTSAPEMLISGFAAWQGNPGLAIGNAIGSNITNIALVIGATALVSPLAVQSQTLRREFPLLVAVQVGVLVFLLNGTLTRLDSFILLAALAVFMGWTVYVAHKARRNDPLRVEMEHELVPTMRLGTAVLWFLVGLGILLFSSRILVWGAVTIAKAFGISDLIIGLTIIAIGTSLPELASSIVSARRGEADLAIGNIIGSNIFNVLGVLPIAGVIHPILLPSEVLTRDYPIMLALTLAFVLMGVGLRGGRGRITRLEGAILLACFVGYEVLIYLSL